jgi:ribosome-binding protein aMBF1 (putative translation factor)
MNAPTDIQTIMKDGKPAFVVIPYSEYIRLFPTTQRIPAGDAVPHEVVSLMVDNDWSIIRAWREYLELTQLVVAERAGISQAALSQMESSGKRLRKTTREKLAAALGITAGQLAA